LTVFKASVISGFVSNKKLSKQTISDKVKILRPGKFFVVESESERQDALNAARFHGKEVSSRKRKSGGFTIWGIF
jgi:hypothetical protein